MTGLKDEEENWRLAQWGGEESIVNDSLIQTLTEKKKKLQPCIISHELIFVF